MGDYLLGEDTVDLAELGFCGDTITITCPTCGELLGNVPVELLSDGLEDPTTPSRSCALLSPKAFEKTGLVSPPRNGWSSVAVHSQNNLLSNDIMRGQVLSGIGVEAGSKLRPPPSMIVVVALLLHVDTAGDVTGFDVKDDWYKSMTPEAGNAVRQWKFRVSYQGSHPVAADIPVTLWSGTP